MYTVVLASIELVTTNESENEPDSPVDEGDESSSDIGTLKLTGHPVNGIVESSLDEDKDEDEEAPPPAQKPSVVLRDEINAMADELTGMGLNKHGIKEVAQPIR
jgi:hypothetical protein